eukprot:11486560-Alexandrium_andersonii.AAC.1
MPCSCCPGTQAPDQGVGFACLLLPRRPHTHASRARLSRRVRRLPDGYTLTQNMSISPPIQKARDT